MINILTLSYDLNFLVMNTHIHTYTPTHAHASTHMHIGQMGDVMGLLSGLLVRVHFIRVPSVIASHNVMDFSLV